MNLYIEINFNQREKERVNRLNVPQREADNSRQGSGIEQNLGP